MWKNYNENLQINETKLNCTRSAFFVLNTLCFIFNEILWGIKQSYSINGFTEVKRY